MSDGEERKITPEEILKVQNLVELCISRYMWKDEVMELLYLEKDIEPVFTKTVWESLEEENPKFFEAYILSLMVKDQINRWNNLVERQAEVTNLLNGLVSNGSHKPPLDYNASYYNNGNIAIKAENMQQSFPAYIPSEIQQGPLNMVFAQNSNVAAVNGNSKFVYEANGGFLESHDPGVSSFGLLDSIPHDNQFIETLMDDTRSSQLLRQLSHDIIPLNETTADITDTTDTEGQRFDPYTSTNYEFQNRNFGKDT